MTELTTEDVQALHASHTVTSPDGEDQEVRDRSLDEERGWVELACPNGHKLIAEAHEGGSRAICNQCGQAVDYGGYVHQPVEDAMRKARIGEARALLEAEGELPPAPDRHVVDGDEGNAGEASSSTGAVRP